MEESNCYTSFTYESNFSILNSIEMNEINELAKQDKFKFENIEEDLSFNKEKAFFDNILNINIYNPRSAAAFYRESLTLIENEKKNVHFKDLPNEDKAKYKALENKEKDEYNKNIAFVKRYILNPDILDDNRRVYDFFKDKYIVEVLENDSTCTYEEALNIVLNKWNGLMKDEVNYWKEQFKEEKLLLEELIKHKPILRISPFNLYLSEMYILNKTPKEQATSQWEAMDDIEKKKYIEKVNKINTEREKIKDLYTIANGIKPKRPSQPRYLYYNEMKRNKTKRVDFTNIKEEADDVLYDNLTEEEKEIYLKKHKVLTLKYHIKLIEYKKNNKLKIINKIPFDLYYEDKKDIIMKEYNDSASSNENDINNHNHNENNSYNEYIYDYVSNINTDSDCLEEINFYNINDPDNGKYTKFQYKNEYIDENDPIYKYNQRLKASQALETKQTHKIIKKIQKRNKTNKPKLKYEDLVKKIKEMWREESEEVKNQYKNKLNDMKEYHKLHDVEENEPKMPLGPYNKFISEYRQAYKTKKGYLDSKAFEEGLKKWKNLTESEKEDLYLSYKRELEDYKSRLVEYKKKVKLSLGNNQSNFRRKIREKILTSEINRINVSKSRPRRDKSRNNKK